MKKELKDNTAGQRFKEEKVKSHPTVVRFILRRFNSVFRPFDAGKASGKNGYMTDQNRKNFDELPLYMNVPDMAKLLGISESSGYALVHEKGFPAFRIGSRIVIERDKLKAWIERRLQEGVVS